MIVFTIETLKMNNASEKEINEHKILLQICNGSKTAFEIFFKQYYRILCNYAYGIISDRNEAEEVVQDLFCKIWEQRENLVKLQSVKAYLYRSVHNKCINKIRHTKIKLAYMEHSKRENFNITSPVSEIQLKELQEKIQKAISDLPKQCGLVFKLSRNEEMSYKEIAKMLEISYKTVENHMGKALKLLRIQMAEYLTVFTIFFTYFF